MHSWTEQQAGLQALAGLQLFLVGGAPRSGTTWLQYLLDAHPAISCSGEGHFHRFLAEPIEQMIAACRKALEQKNRDVFAHSEGFALPDEQDSAYLIGSAILLALERQRRGKDCRAIGEKTPENVFFFPWLKGRFPQAKLIVIARDPRDVLASSWHFFHRPMHDEDEIAAKLEFLRLALPSVHAGTQATLAAMQHYPSDCLVITYEAMLRDTADMAGRLYRFLGVSDDPQLVAQCVERTNFTALSGGRRRGDAQDGSFFRKGVAGDWRATFSDEMNAIILRDVGWTFPHFGWEP